MARDSGRHTYLIVESAEPVMNSLGSLGCHAQDVNSPTCPLEETGMNVNKAK